MYLALMPSIENTLYFSQEIIGLKILQTNNVVVPLYQVNHFHHVKENVKRKDNSLESLKLSGPL